MEPRDDEPDGGVPRRRRGAGAAWLHDGVRRRPLSVSWTLRSGGRELHRIRRPESDREFRVPVGRRSRRAARAGFRTGAGVRQLPSGVAALVRVGNLGARAPDRSVMSATAVDYSLTGESAIEAEQRGLANAEWFQPEVDGATLRALQSRTNRRAGLEVGLWLVLLVGAGVWAWTTVW